MLVSHTKRFIFSKTVKTGGTSTEVAFQPACLPPDGQSIPAECGAIVSEFGIVGARGANATQFEWWHHMSAKAIKDGVGPEVWNSYFKFTVIRNPFDKVVSWFHFRNPHVKELPKGQMFAAFNSWISDAGSIPGDRDKYMIGGEFVLDDTARYENLETELYRIASKLDVQLGAVPRLKAGPRGPKRIPYTAYYGSDARALVERSFDYELSAFDYEF